MGSPDPSSTPYTIRHAEPGDETGIARTQVASWADAYTGVMPADVLNQLNVARRQSQWARTLPNLRLQAGRQALLVGVHPAGEIHGFVHGGVERTSADPKAAEIYSFYIHPAAQFPALGNRLMGEMGDWLRRRGHENLRLWVLEPSPIRRFYEELGGRRLPEEQQIHLGSYPVRQISYLWDDLKSLLSRLQP